MEEYHLLEALEWMGHHWGRRGLSCIEHVGGEKALVWLHCRDRAALLRALRTA